jgi:hypothetical protein
MLKALRSTRALLALASLAILLVAALTLPDAFTRIVPRCVGTLGETADTPYLSEPDDPFEETIALGQERDGVVLRLDTELASDGRVGWARIVRVERDVRGEACECGSVRLRDAGVSSAGGRVQRRHGGVLVYVDARWGEGAGQFRIIDRAKRNLQRDRIFVRESLPVLIALLAVGAIGVASCLTRRATGYATRLHSWTEARFEASGRVVSHAGEIVGVLDDVGRSLVHGAVLVAPEATAAHGIYRDVPILARRHVALGTHVQWRGATMRRLRDARVLALISAACAVAGFAASLSSR